MVNKESVLVEDQSPNDKFQRLLKYPGIFDKHANNLYQSIRNLYSLSMR